MKTKRPPTLIQTARQAAKITGVRLYSGRGLALAVALLKKGATSGVAAPSPAPFVRERTPRKGR